MKTKYYKCTLLSDVILNKSMATTGNVGTLDYIPGSVFLGIVAKEIYDEEKEKAYDILHSGKVKFGDATISSNGQPSYHYPICLYSDKLKPKGDKFLHHLTKENYPTNKEGNKIQLKQVRSGYFNLESETELNIVKRFSMKSARDKDTRKAKDAQLFGYEALKERQPFVFTITYEDESFITLIENALIGNKRIGKSKTAEYSSVEIEKIETDFKHQCKDEKEYTLVYANSHLCFFDENGQPNLQPTAEDLGVEGKIDWEKSQVRTYEYTSWNGKRNTPNAQRFCIARGSVFYIDKKNKGKNDFVGEYQAEGLGNILVNPSFLFSVRDNNIWNLNIEEKEGEIQNSNVEITTGLGKLLHEKKKEKELEHILSETIQEIIKYGKKQKLYLISSSQWGGIRRYATQYTDYKILYNKLFEDTDGYLNHGIAYEKYWMPNGDKNLKIFKGMIKDPNEKKNDDKDTKQSKYECIVTSILEEREELKKWHYEINNIFDDLDKKQPLIIAKFASEMVNENQKRESNGRK